MPSTADTVNHQTTAVSSTPQSKVPNNHKTPTGSGRSQALQITFRTDQQVLSFYEPATFGSNTLASQILPMASLLRRYIETSPPRYHHGSFPATGRVEMPQNNYLGVP